MRRTTRVALIAFIDALAEAPVEDIVELMWPYSLLTEVWDGLERRHPRAYATAVAARDAIVRETKERRRAQRLAKRRALLVQYGGNPDA
jgi:hypothetical protein